MGNVIKNGDLYCVQIQFSKEGAQDFGKELINSTHDDIFDGNFHIHLAPVNGYEVPQAMGIALTNDSPELVIAFGHLGDIASEMRRAQRL
ncbi:MAG TPA: hypothetical protein VHO84_16520 [Syntrophorhabdaceae bacterium]|nr:hypothetical protein [Syntrophorhabdaceae bacterium]